MIPQLIAHLTPGRIPPCVSAGTTVSYLCQSTNGSFSVDSFTVKLTVTVTDPVTGCTNTDEKSVTVATPCCATGSSFAKGEGGFSTATCFKDPSMSAICGNARWGWQNRLSANGGPSTYYVIAGAGNGLCTGGSIVGQLSITCSGSTVSTVTLGALSQTTIPAIGAAENHMYLGCKDISKCNPPNFIASTKNTACSTSGTNKDQCGGTIGILTTPKTYTMPCSCAGIRWAFHQGLLNGGQFTTSRNADGTCPLTS